MWVKGSHYANHILAIAEKKFKSTLLYISHIAPDISQKAETIQISGYSKAAKENL